MNIKSYLPSKQFSKFLGIALAIGICIFLILRFVDIKTSTRQKIQNIATREIVEEIDTDNDGLKDWEEALWGMDFENADTDDDGILDGQEVEKIREEMKNSDEYVEVDAVPETETEKIARQLLTVALNINQTSGGTLTKEQINSLAEGFMSSTKPTVISLYSMSDLNISTTKTAQSYYEEMSEELSYLESIPANELIILEHAISTKREKKLDDLEPIIDAYSKVGEKVLDNEIPTQVAAYHLDYINAITYKAITIVSMAQYFKDPIIAVRGVEEYRIADQKQQEASNKINQYLTLNGVVR
jgi:hypothetical protein